MLLPRNVIIAVLLAALLHASWNITVRAGPDRRRETALLVAGGAMLAGAILPFMPLPSASAWKYLIASAALDTVYFALIAEIYARGGVALAYPLMRGTAPMLTALASWGLIGEALPVQAWLGIGAICCGVILLAYDHGQPNERRAVRLALTNAVVIAASTLNDAVGARVSGSPFAYALWLFPLMAVPTLCWLYRSTPLQWPSWPEARRGVGGATCVISSYGLLLYAMTASPVAPVAALREISILFGVGLARLLLRERPGLRDWAGALVIATGAVILRLT